MLRVGFLGAGHIATYHSKLLRRADVPFERAGVFDLDPTRTAAFAAASGQVPASSEDEVIDGCDAVFVCTWTSEHPRLVRAALAKGRAVFVEKPLAMTLPEAEALTNDVVASGVVNQVGLSLRHSPAYLWARHLLDDDAAGPVQAVVFRDDQFIPVQGHYRSTWRADVGRAGAGTLLEHSIHDLDMLRFLVGEIDRVSAHAANWHGHDGIEDTVAVTLSFATGGRGTLLSVWHDNLARPSLRHVEVFASRRYVEITGDDWFGPVRWTDHDGTTGELEGEALVVAAEALCADVRNPTAAFVRAASEHRPAFPDVTVALAAHRVADAVYRSAAIDGDAVAVAVAVGGDRAGG